MSKNTQCLAQIPCILEPEVCLGHSDNSEAPDDWKRDTIKKMLLKTAEQSFCTHTKPNHHIALILHMYGIAKMEEPNNHTHKITTMSNDQEKMSIPNVVNETYFFNYTIKLHVYHLFSLLF